MSAESLRVFPMTPRRHYVRRLNEGHEHLRRALACFRRKYSGWTAEVEIHAEFARRTLREARLLGRGVTDEQLGYEVLCPVPPYLNPTIQEGQMSDLRIGDPVRVATTEDAMTLLAVDGDAAFVRTDGGHKVCRVADLEYATPAVRHSKAWHQAQADRAPSHGVQA